MKTKNTDFESSYYTWHCSIIKYWTRSREQMHIMHAVYDSTWSCPLDIVRFIFCNLFWKWQIIFHIHFFILIFYQYLVQHQCDIIGEPGLDAHSIHGESHCTLLTFILNFSMCCGLNFETVWKIYLDKSFWDPKGLVIPFKKSFDSMAKLIWVCLTSSQCVM